MKLYDIIAEVRQVGRGNYAGFVWDQPTGSRDITVTFPDGRTTTVTNQADARRVADDWLQRSRPAAPPKQPVETDDLSRAERRQLSRTGRITRGGQTYTRAEIDAFTQQAQTRRAQAQRDADAGRGSNTPNRANFSTKFRAVRRSLGTAGGIVLTVAMWNEIEETMAALYQAHANGEIPNRQDYERAVATAFGAWVAVAAPAAISVLSTGGRAIVAALRRLNMASSVAMLAGGPLGVFAGVLKFVIWEAGTWVAAYYISNSEWAQKAVASMIFSRIGQTLFPIMDLGAQAVANVDNIIERVINPDTSQTAANREERNARRLVGLDPNDIASKRIGGEPLPAARDSAAEPASASGSSPGAAAPAGSNPLVNPNLGR